MSKKNFYLLKAAQFRLRVQTEHDIGVRWAMEAWITCCWPRDVELKLHYLRILNPRREAHFKINSKEL